MAFSKLWRSGRELMACPLCGIPGAASKKNEAVEIGVGVWERKATASPLNRRRFQINSGDQFAELLLAEQSGVLGRHGAMYADLASLQLRAMVPVVLEGRVVYSVAHVSSSGCVNASVQFT
jgi:hypothetical protein